MGLEWLFYLTLGTAAGFLGGLLGIGGGLLIVPALAIMLAEQVPQYAMQMAVATSLASIVFTGSSSVLAHHRRAAVRWSLAWRLALGLAGGALLGALMAARSPAALLSLGFGLFCCVVGGRMWLQRPEQLVQRRMGPWMPTLVAIVIGAVSSLVGIGGGSLVVPFLCAHQVDIRAAVGTAAACGLPIALAGSVGFVLAGWSLTLPGPSLGFVYLPALLGVSMTSVLAAPLGTRVAHWAPRRSLQRYFGGFLLLLGVYMAGRGWMLSLAEALG